MPTRKKKKHKQQKKKKQVKNRGGTTMSKPQQQEKDIITQHTKNMTVEEAEKVIDDTLSNAKESKISSIRENCDNSSPTCSSSKTTDNQTGPGLLDLKDSSDALNRFRIHYTMVGKEDWWWIFDDSLKEMARQLLVQDFVVLDGFVTRKLSDAIKAELCSMYEEGTMKQGLLAGGRTGQNTKYSLVSVRGDYVAWVDGQHPSQKNIHTYLQRVDTCVNELSTFLPELKSITNRSEAMCTCYPGSGARYTRHCDNPNQNGRKLTALLYLNESWKGGHGGELKTCHPAPFETHPKAILPPLSGRVILFWSDTRVPHEVLPVYIHRYAVTVWYFDGAEKARADAFARQAAAKDQNTSESKEFERENARIRNEIEKFQATSINESARIITSGEEAEQEEGGRGANQDTNQLEEDILREQLGLDSDDELPQGAYRLFTPAARNILLKADTD